MNKPILTTFLRGISLYFYATPLDDGRPDGPWVDVLNVLALLPMSNMECAYIADAYRRDWFDLVQEVAADQGRTLMLTPWLAAAPMVSAMLHQLVAEDRISQVALVGLWTIMEQSGQTASCVMAKARPDLFPQGMDSVDAAQEARWGAHLLREREPDGKPN